jgi:hypothetical protein
MFALDFKDADAATFTEDGILDVGIGEIKGAARLFMRSSRKCALTGRPGLTQTTLRSVRTLDATASPTS